MLLAKYLCLSCEHKYEAKPGPTECPICGHLYIKWLNYEEMFGGRLIGRTSDFDSDNRGSIPRHRASSNSKG